MVAAGSAGKWTAEVTGGVFTPFIRQIDYESGFWEAHFVAVYRIVFWGEKWYYIDYYIHLSAYHGRRYSFV